MPEDDVERLTEPRTAGQRGEAVPTGPERDAVPDTSRLPVPPSPDLDQAVAAMQCGEACDVHEELLFKTLYRPLFVLFRNYPLPPAEAEDLTQTTLMRVFDHIAEYRSTGALWSWVKEIAMNTLSNHFRDQAALKRGAALQVSLEATLAARGDADRKRPRTEPFEDAVAETRLLAGEDAGLLRRALAELPERMRQVVALRLADLGYEEIAEALGVGLNTVRTQLHEARKRLRRILAEHFPEHGGGEER